MINGNLSKNVTGQTYDQNPLIIPTGNVLAPWRESDNVNGSSMRAKSSSLIDTNSHRFTTTLVSKAQTDRRLLIVIPHGFQGKIRQRYREY